MFVADFVPNRFIFSSLFKKQFGKMHQILEAALDLLIFCSPPLSLNSAFFILSEIIKRRVIYCVEEC